MAGLGFDNLFQRLGVSSSTGVGGRPLSQIVGDIVLVVIMFFATIQALYFLHFDELALIVTRFGALGVQILLALALFAVGIWLSNIAYQAIVSSGMNQALLLAVIARFAILILAAAMALNQTGLAPEIVNSAFILLLGALAVATALAFGLGGRDTAASILENARHSLKEPVIPPMLPPSTGITPTIPPSTGSTPAVPPATGD